MGRFGQCNGPFWTIFLEIKIFGAVLVGAVLAMGRFGIDPLGDRDCIAQYSCGLPATTDCQHFCPFVCFLLSNFVRCPCNVFDMIVSP